MNRKTDIKTKKMFFIHEVDIKERLVTNYWKRLTVLINTDK